MSSCSPLVEFLVSKSLCHNPMDQDVISLYKMVNVDRNN